jgi:hypothetical protein
MKNYLMLENRIGFKFGVGAQFIVSKKNILKKNQEFYLNIVKMLIQFEPD